MLSETPQVGTNSLGRKARNMDHPQKKSAQKNTSTLKIPQSAGFPQRQILRPPIRRPHRRRALNLRHILPQPPLLDPLLKTLPLVAIADHKPILAPENGFAFLVEGSARGEDFQEVPWRLVGAMLDALAEEVAVAAGQNVRQGWPRRAGVQRSRTVHGWLVVWGFVARVAVVEAGLDAVVDEDFVVDGVAELAG